MWASGRSGSALDVRAARSTARRRGPRMRDSAAAALSPDCFDKVCS